MIWIIKFIIIALLAMMIHELGHTIVSKILTGNFLKFRFAFGWLWKIPIPRFIWNMPLVTRSKQRYIALAGFVTEVLSTFPFLIYNKQFGLMYGIFVIIHYFAYSHYAGDASDFKWF